MYLSVCLWSGFDVLNTTGHSMKFIFTFFSKLFSDYFTVSRLSSYKETQGVTVVHFKSNFNGFCTHVTGEELKGADPSSSDRPPNQSTLQHTPLPRPGPAHTHCGIVDCAVWDKEVLLRVQWQRNAHYIHQEAERGQKTDCAYGAAKQTHSPPKGRLIPAVLLPVFPGRYRSSVIAKSQQICFFNLFILFRPQVLSVWGLKKNCKNPSKPATFRFLSFI